MIGEKYTGRHLPSADYTALKAAFRRLVRAAGGGRASAAVTVVDAARISLYGNPNTPDSARCDVIADLEGETGDPIVTRELARLSGYVLVPVPVVAGDPVWLQHMADNHQELGDVVQRITAALQGKTRAGVVGDITADEIHEMDLKKEAFELLETAARLYAAVDQAGGER